MRKYDFVFIYEVKNRELENICLLRYELEKRGYKVAFVSFWDDYFKRKMPLNTKVTIVSALYDNDFLRRMNFNVINCDKFVNMQWEQVVTNSEAAKDSSYADKLSGTKYFGVSGLAKKAMHICWGENNYNRLVDQFGVPEKNLCITGHITLDFLRPELRNYYLNRYELLKKFNLPFDKKVCLFISSFSLANYPSGDLKNVGIADNAGRDMCKTIELTQKSQKEVLLWIEKLLSENEDIVFIYRPHPAENNNINLVKMAKRYKNFYVIGDLSVKQWILCSDKIYTWMSTAIAEIYVAEKTCSILRPVQIPFDFDIQVYNNAKYITEYDDFKNTLDCDMPFPIEETAFDKNYSIDKQYPTYKRICDWLEKIYENNEYNMNCVHEVRTTKSLIKYNVYMLLTRMFIRNNITRKLWRRIYPTSKLDLESYLYYKKLYINNHSTKKEINKILLRIRNTLDESCNKGD